MYRKICCALQSCLILLALPAAAYVQNHRRCIILLEQRGDIENLGRISFYLTCKLHSAITEQCCPILVSGALWNSFIEKRIAFEQCIKQQKSLESIVLSTYNNINERIAYWQDYYSNADIDGCLCKDLVVQHINQEFYDCEKKTKIKDEEYQLLLNYTAFFDPAQWHVYKNDGGFFLLIPQKYCVELKNIAELQTNLDLLYGFKISSLQKVEHPEQAGNLFFDVQALAKKSIVQNLEDFFLKVSDLPDNMSYAWDIVLSGHGGWLADETNNKDKIELDADLRIADLTLKEFCSLLDFFNTSLKVNSLLYSTCYGGGNHSIVPFTKTYNYTIICSCLTDNYSHCKWDNNLPGARNFLTTADLSYSSSANHWKLPLERAYNWNNYFEALEKIDLQEGISKVNFTSILKDLSCEKFENTSLLRLPGAGHFYPLYPPSYSKISDQMLAIVKKNKNVIKLHDLKVLLLESLFIDQEILIDNCFIQHLRIISIKPGNAIHYFKKISLTKSLNLAEMFWQGAGQCYEKIFLIDELHCPHNADIESLLCLDAKNDLIFKRVLIINSKNQFLRIFFTLDNAASMIIVSWPEREAVIKEVVPLNTEARAAYEKHYTLLAEKMSTTTK